MNYCDLHTHTTCSDWDLTPKELLKLASSYWLVWLSITDHDSIEAYTDDVIKLAEELRIKLLSGVEISTFDESNNRKYHILGYWFDLNSKVLNDELDNIKQVRIDISLEMANLLKDHWWNIDDKDIKNYAWTVTKTTIAEMVLWNSGNKDKLIEHYWVENPNLWSFIEDRIILWKPCFVKQDDKLSPKEAIDLIHKTWWLAILAHPSEYVIKWERIEDFTKNMIEYWIDWFEAISIVNKHQDQKTIPINNREYLENLCREKNLIITWGSDFHSKDKEKYWEDIIDLWFKNHKWKVEEWILNNIYDILKVFSK